MASGDHGGAVRTIDADDLPYGYALTLSGRVSGVTEAGELSVQYPFPINGTTKNVPACCQAAPGYDTASGLGSPVFARLVK